MWLLLAFPAFMPDVCVAAAPPPPRPNIIVILCDDLGWGDLAGYGHPHIRTPHLDKLAAEGIRFTSAYSAAVVCSPSRAGLLTGRNPNRAGIFDWIPDINQANIAGRQSRHLVQLRKQEITLPELLKASGYATALTGKWHCNGAFNSPAQAQPGDAGFDHWFATQNNAAPSHRNPVNFVRNGKPVGPQQGYSCQIVAGEAIGWIEKQRAEQAEKPFFLYVAFHEPHEPVASPPELVSRYLSVARNNDEAEYFANVENMDSAVGRITGALDRLGIARDTLIYFSSDNGPETLKNYKAATRSYGSPGPLRGRKLSTTEGGCRVPGIARWTGTIQPGQTVDTPVSSLDLLPTFCTLAGAPLPADHPLDGTDFSPLIRGGQLTREKPLIWVYFNATNDQRVAMRDGDWKLLAKLDQGKATRLHNITAATAPQVRAAKLTDFSLYRLTTDPAEAEDLSASEPEQLARLTTR
ncbi:MAG: arylsulfatase, partial [Verrucomicrobiaceae bacterium]